MAAISWSVEGMQVSEAERAQAIAAGESSFAALEAVRLGKPPAVQDPTSPLDVHAITGSNLSGQLNRIPLTYIEPYGWIPSGTNSLVDAFQQGFRYLNGQWINTSVAQGPSTIGIPTVTTVPGASTVNTTPSGLNQSVAAALDLPFVGGNMGSIRMTTGIAAEGGALTPIRFGSYRADLPRIVMDEIAT